MTSAVIERRFRRIYDVGCLCCRVRGWRNECQAHHLNLGQHAGQPRLGDDATVGLCPWHHEGKPVGGRTQAQCRRMLGPSMALESKAFREEFGSDADLLAKQNELIAELESCVVGRVVA